MKKKIFCMTLLAATVTVSGIRAQARFTDPQSILPVRIEVVFS